jgi:hypothetical protein
VFRGVPCGGSGSWEATCLHRAFRVKLGNGPADGNAIDSKWIDRSFVRRHAAAELIGEIFKKNDVVPRLLRLSSLRRQ